MLGNRFMCMIMVDTYLYNSELLDGVFLDTFLHPIYFSFLHKHICRYANV